MRRTGGCPRSWALIVRSPRCLRPRYRAILDNGFIEDEFVHAFAGAYDGPVAPALAEVSEWRWIGFAALEQDRRARPDAYAVWFRHYLDAHGDVIAGWLKA